MFLGLRRADSVFSVGFKDGGIHMAHAAKSFLETIQILPRNFDKHHERKILSQFGCLGFSHIASFVNDKTRNLRNQTTAILANCINDQRHVIFSGSGSRKRVQSCATSNLERQQKEERRNTVRDSLHGLRTIQIGSSDGV